MTRLTDAERIERAVQELRQARQDFSPADLAYDLGLLTRQVTGHIRAMDGVYQKRTGRASIWGFE